MLKSQTFWSSEQSLLPLAKTFTVITLVLFFLILERSEKFIKILCLCFMVSSPWYGSHLGMAFWRLARTKTWNFWLMTSSVASRCLLRFDYYVWSTANLIFRSNHVPEAYPNNRSVSHNDTKECEHATARRGYYLSSYHDSAPTCPVFSSVC